MKFRSPLPSHDPPSVGGRGSGRGGEGGCRCFERRVQPREIPVICVPACSSNRNAHASRKATCKCDQMTCDVAITERQTPSPVLVSPPSRPPPLFIEAPIPDGGAEVLVVVTGRPALLLKCCPAGRVQGGRPHPRRARARAPPSERFVNGARGV